jgi:hypothetical protein
MKCFVRLVYFLLLICFGSINAAEPRLHLKVKEFVASGRCDKVTQCGQFVEVSCHPELDGPLGYFNNTTGEQIMKCGGVCDSPSRNSADPKACKECPPLQWAACKKNEKPLR